MKRFTWSKKDTIAWCQQAIKVLAPYLIVIIPVVVAQLPRDWAYATIVIYILNRIWDALRRWYGTGPT